MDCALREVSETYNWDRGICTYRDMPVSELAFMDDCLLWEGTTTKLQDKLSQLQSVLTGWGLRINLAKCSLYVSPKHQGPREITIGGEVLLAQESLTVMGVDFKVGNNVREMLREHGNEPKPSSGAFDTFYVPKPL